MQNKSSAFEKLAQNTIKELEKRNMEGYYFSDSKSCVEAILNMMPEKSVISWGGTQTFSQSGMYDAIKNANYTLIDRATAKTPEEARALFGKIVCADYFLTSSNAFLYGFIDIYTIVIYIVFSYFAPAHGAYDFFLFHISLL